MKKIFFVFAFIFALLFASNPSYAENFYIKNYDVSVDVQNNGSFKVSEGIDVFFTKRAHGIIRDIPKKGAKIDEIDGTQIHGIRGDSYVKSIKMGDSNNLVSGDKTYKISYKITPKKTDDEFYFNIIGTEWNTNIDNVSFKVTLPKEFDTKDVHLYKGKYGKETVDNSITYKVEGNTIKGKITAPLYSREGITILVKLPEGYFEKTSGQELYTTALFILICLLCVFLIWKKIGKEDLVTPVVTFDAPSDIDVLDSEVTLDMQASTNGFAAYIVELASKKYITIESEHEDFTLIKNEENVKNASEREQEAINIIFKDKNEVTNKELEVSKTFYLEVQEFLSNVNKTKNDAYEEESLNPFSYAAPVILTACIFFSTCNIAADFDIDAATNIATFLLFPVVSMIFTKAGQSKSSKEIFLGGGGIFNAILFSFIIFKIYPNILKENLPYFAFGLFALIFCLICIFELPKRTKKGNKILGELLGLKHFIQTAEKHRLEKMVNENPSYFYNILPYAFILGVSDVWIDNFKDIFANNSEYEGANFTKGSFGDFTGSMARCSGPSYENGGVSRSSSGGGFSGGGHGGGGGSSW